MCKKNVVKFRRKPKRRQGYHPPWRLSFGMQIFLGAMAFLILVVVQRADIVKAGVVNTDVIYTKDMSSEDELVCYDPYILDGDTLECDGERVRLVGIDSPEMQGHCRPGRRCVEGDADAAKDYLESITSGWVECVSQGQDHYGRMLGRCKADKVDLSCEMLKAGHAERRYGNIICW